MPTPFDRGDTVVLTCVLGLTPAPTYDEVQGTVVYWDEEDAQDALRECRALAKALRDDGAARVVLTVARTAFTEVGE